jgi:hypothetical protein
MSGGARSHFQTPEIVQRVDLLAEPARRLRAGGVAVDPLEIVLGINLVLELVASAIQLPGEKLAILRPERHRREEGQRRVLAGMESG